MSFRTGSRISSPGDGRRFTVPKAESERIMALADNHPAVVEGRTLFPSTVTAPMDSPRMLISGANNAKLGRVVKKGAWAGMPVFQLTLEERRTCPSSCPVWTTCYGNAVHLGRRHDAFHEDFLVALWAEVVSTYRAIMNERAPPPGIVVRLHVLGDFFSPQYVAVWADLLDKLPGLHVFGYTARREDADDELSRATAAAVRDLTDRNFDRFAIRYSRAEAGPQRAVVFDTVEAATDAGAVVCPAQMEQTDSCSTCGLCWAPAFKGTTIGFLRHGRKPPKGPRPKPTDPAVSARPSAPRRFSFEEQVEADWDALPPGSPGSPEWWAARGG